MEDNNTSERNNTGVVHSGHGGSVVHDPDKPEESKAGISFPKRHGLLKDHRWRIHNMLVIYYLRVRGTKNSWITIIDNSGCRPDRQTLAAGIVITGGATR
jgi:hypothetical protein